MGGGGSQAAPRRAADGRAVCCHPQPVSTRTCLRVRRIGVTIRVGRKEGDFRGRAVVLDARHTPRAIEEPRYAGQFRVAPRQALTLSSQDCVQTGGDRIGHGRERGASRKAARARAWWAKTVLVRVRTVQSCGDPADCDPQGVALRALMVLASGVLGAALCFWRRTKADQREPSNRATGA